ncbi:unnamed protein product [Discosporangium mesarthrocarpum]
MSRSSRSVLEYMKRWASTSPSMGSAMRNWGAARQQEHGQKGSSDNNSPPPSPLEGPTSSPLALRPFTSMSRKMSSPSGSGASEGSVVEESEEDGQTKRVILDFSRVVGIDATAARACFLILKKTLERNGAVVVFAGAKREVLTLLRAHGVVESEDPVFESLDSALEWSEEQLLDDVAEASRKQVHPVSSLSVPTCATGRGSYSSMTNGDLALSGSSQSHGGQGVGGTTMPASDAATAGDGTGDEVAAERILLGQHEKYYARASFLRRRSTYGSALTASLIHDAEKAGQEADEDDCLSLQSILEDYLEVDRYKASQGMRKVLREANNFFREETCVSGTVLLRETVPSDRLRFISSGTVELKIMGDTGPRRLLRISVGGTFGEMGFYLKRRQPFRAVALEPCRIFTLDRAGMARMQTQNPGLCTLVQKAVMKSMCLTACFSMEGAHLGPIDEEKGLQ